MGSNKITASTFIPMSSLVVFAVALLWIYSIKAQGDSNSRQIATLESQQEKHDEVVQSIDRRLSRIEGAVGVAKDR